MRYTPSAICKKCQDIEECADTALPDVDAQFEQFAVDARCTPNGILPAHLANQISDFA